MPAGARSRIRRRPSRSSEVTGSSNHVTPRSVNFFAISSACLREYAPLASTYSEASVPIDSRAAFTRSKSSSGSRPIFIFTALIPWSTHPPSCRCSCSNGVRGESTAAIYLCARLRGSQERNQRKIQKRRFQIPNCGVDGRDGHRADAWPAQVPYGVPHFRPSGRHVHCALSLDQRNEHVFNQICRGNIRVRVAHANFAGGSSVDQNDCGVVPLQSAVRLRKIGRNGVGVY